MALKALCRILVRALLLATKYTLKVALRVLLNKFPFLKFIYKTTKITLACICLFARTHKVRQRSLLRPLVMLYLMPMVNRTVGGLMGKPTSLHGLSPHVGWSHLRVLDAPLPTLTRAFQRQLWITLVGRLMTHGHLPNAAVPRNHGVLP